MRGRRQLIVTFIVAVVAVTMLPWLREVAIENLLLIGRNIGDSIALRRCPIELMGHSLDQPTPWHVQVMIPVGRCAQREPNQDA